MKLAISNIAWDVSEDEAIAALLTQNNIHAIDIAPGKYFPNPREASPAEIKAVLSWWLDRGFDITGMQALLFGTTGLNVFGDADSQTRMLQHLEAVCRIAGALGARRLVFGSPRQRDKGTLTDVQAQEVAQAFFFQLGEIAADNGVTICLEPNPVAYGANFMTNSRDTLAVVKAIDHPAIRMQIDTGAIAMNAESPAEVITAAWPWVGHVHASEPNLVPIGDASAPHIDCAAAIARLDPDALVCIEMVATSQEPHMVSIERAIQAASRAYRQPSEGFAG